MKASGTDTTLVALFGFIAIAGNVAAVVLLQDSPSAYKVEQISAWYSQALADPADTVAASWAFTVGLAAMIPFVVGLVALGRQSPLAWMGASSVAAGAMLNAAGTLLPAMAVLYLDDLASTGRAFLALTIGLDAAFNLFLGVGLALLNFAWWSDPRWPRALAALGIFAGLASVPVAGQAFDDMFAYLLLLSGPLWLAWIAAACFVALRRGSSWGS